MWNAVSGGQKPVYLHTAVQPRYLIHTSVTDDVSILSILAPRNIV